MQCLFIKLESLKVITLVHWDAGCRQVFQMLCEYRPEFELCRCL